MPLPLRARYVHTNLVAEDWRALARFYEAVFGCRPVPPERDYRGPDLERGTGVAGSGLRGIHLRLPGAGDDGPTLEIYQYDRHPERPAPAANRLGYGHIAFEVEDVEAGREAVLAHGGAAIGEVVTLATRVGARVRWCYVTDPEGNIVELQSWA
ncbi:MAG: VOC family protein [Rhodothermales bacterium]|nr:VOC family protein [Rhodothermales bacterium]